MNHTWLPLAQLPVGDATAPVWFLSKMMIKSFLISLMLVPLIPGPPVHYEAPQGERIAAVVTAYTSSVDETDEDPWTTASGSKAGPGTLACPAKYAFGTEVLIAGRTYTCSDRMHSRYRDLSYFDLWVASKAEAREWGKRELSVLIYTNAH